MEADKQTSKKPVPVEKIDGDIALAVICQQLKMEPRVARRVLRAAKAKVDGGRWTWRKGSAEVARVTKLLKESQSTKGKK